MSPSQTQLPVRQAVPKLPWTLPSLIDMTDQLTADDVRALRRSAGYLRLAA
jgi:hypothetical protein